MLHKETISAELGEIVSTLCAIPELESFRLVGGTAVALQLGHRKSVDVDFFSNQKLDRKTILRVLKQQFTNAEFFVTEHSVESEINGVRVELYDDWSVPFMSPPLAMESMRIASLIDLAALKLNAITERRDKKDYIDLYFLFKVVGVLDALTAFRISNSFISDKSLVFALLEVAEAEKNKSPMPDMLTPVSWDEIKKSMIHAATSLKPHSDK